MISHRTKEELLRVGCLQHIQVAFSSAPEDGIMANSQLIVEIRDTNKLIYY